MPSSFPGMDPYLEGSEWTSLHCGLCFEIARMVAPKVRPKYIVQPIRRFVTDVPDDAAASTMYPDVGVLEAGRVNLIRETMVAVAPQPIQLATIVPERVPQIFIEVRDVAERELVTVIEVLSPANKRGQGYRDYLKKRQRRNAGGPTLPWCGCMGGGEAASKVTPYQFRRHAALPDRPD